MLLESRGPARNPERPKKPSGLKSLAGVRVRCVLYEGSMDVVDWIILLLLLLLSLDNEKSTGLRKSRWGSCCEAIERAKHARNQVPLLGGGKAVGASYFNTVTVWIHYVTGSIIDIYLYVRFINRIIRKETTST